MNTHIRTLYVDNGVRICYIAVKRGRKDVLGTAFIFKFLFLGFVVHYFLQ